VALRAKLFNGICLLSCLLAAAASGDDFSFLRLVLPPCLDATDPLPDDDPNSDFLAQEQSRTTSCAQPSGAGAAGPVIWPTAARPPAAPAAASLLALLPGAARSALLTSNSPLRC
jgi:hypothetical protein